MGCCQTRDSVIFLKKKEVVFTPKNQNNIKNADMCNYTFGVNTNSNNNSQIKSDKQIQSVSIKTGKSF